MSETISMPMLRNAVEALRRRGYNMSPIEQCKLHCLEENLRILQDLQLSWNHHQLLSAYERAILYMEESAQSASRIAHAMRLSNRAVSAHSRAAVSRSRKLIEAAGL